ncbi:hypothetical protein [Streptomyces sp. NBC_01237]|uniref:hypothetical protein n=1 Tax=Streptomyces sp. NBC_01237 TaxID=2903790 RepID=UPI002DDB1838|nr:hypothetical protein [Streptomyces sp. NBC_01237]WRZ76413.1 hypothetical protein OG251_35000 [Streptomyces sp. NBC_01237]
MTPRMSGAVAVAGAGEEIRHVPGGRHQPCRVAGVVGRLASGGVGEQADRVREGAP